MPRTENSSYIYLLGCESCNNQIDGFDSFQLAHANGKCIKSNIIESRPQNQASSISSHSWTAATTQDLSQSAITGPTFNCNLNISSFGQSSQFSQIQPPASQMHKKQQDHGEQNDQTPDSSEQFNDSIQAKVNNLPNRATGCAQLISSQLLTLDNIQPPMLHDVCTQGLSSSSGRGNFPVFYTNTYARGTTSADTSGSTSVCSSSPSSTSFDRIIDDIMARGLGYADTAGSNKFIASLADMSTCSASTSPNSSIGRSQVESLDSFLWQGQHSKISNLQAPSMSSFVNTTNQSSFSNVESFGGDSVCTLNVDMEDTDRR
ncbi:hypothetical protein HDU76_013218 [Blyttiomyces sp. JEL0837]|nr:hypothetical protein HDU76_013218 [Blyttiomyces sp. JEL0837]